MTAFFILEMVVVIVSIETLSSVRAYVSGENFWLKSEKNAVYHLQKYGYNHKEEYYQNFKQSIKVPLGDRKARIELDKANPNMDIVREGILEGKNNIANANGMIKLYKRFHSIQFVKNLLEIWRKKDEKLLQLANVAEQLHSEINSSSSSHSKITGLLVQTEIIDNQLSELNETFSANLNDGALWLENLVIRLLFVMALTVIIFRFLLTFSLSSRIKKGLTGIVESANRLAEGDFSFRMVSYSRDEIGELVRSFNYMTDKLETNINNLKSAEEKIKISQAALAEAQHISHIGSWEWDVINDKISWSDELYRIYGVSREEFNPDYDGFIEHIHPDDRAYVKQTIETAGKQKRGIDYYHRIIRKNDGAVRIINGRGRAVVKDHKLIKYIGTAQDVTEAELAREKLRESQAALAEAQHRAHIGSWEWNVKTDTLSWSDELFSIFGVNPADFNPTYEGFLELIHPEDRTYVDNLIKDAEKNKTSLDYYHRIVRKKDGKIRILKCYGGVVIDKKNNIVKITGTAQDVTEAKESEERIKQLSLIASESKNGIIILDKYGKVEWVNDGFTKLSGYKLEDIVGTTADILRKGEDTGLKPGSATYETMVKEKKPVIYEAQNYTKDGRKYWAQTTLSPLLNEKGEIHKIIAIDSDITQLKKTEKNLIRAKEKAEESKRAKEQFLANMSHEIRTPMNGIIGFAKLLEDSPLTPQQQEYLHAIEASGSNLLVIINDILDLSKMEAGKITFEERKMSVSDCVNNAMQILKPKIVNNVAFTRSIDDRIPAFVKGDEVRLNQVLINLISNAIKFTEKGEINVSVKLISEDAESVELEFCVHDTGIGIPKNKQEVIFESFGQASSSTTRKYGGTGLGLTISKELVELQGGTISLQSEPNKGSDFFFTLKFKKCTPAEEDQKDQKKPDEKQIKEKSLASVKILLVEDNKLNQLLASKVLEQWNTFPVIAANGKKAIEQLHAQKFDLVLMDIQMPEMDGYEATNYIRTHISKTLPIIAMTANAMAGEKEKCIKAGLNDLIAKPFDPKELYAKIVQYVKV